MSNTPGTPGSSASSTSQQNPPGGNAGQQSPPPPLAAITKNQGPTADSLYFPERAHVIVMHAFKLEEAVVIKNVGIKTFIPDPSTHSHFFRPLDEYNRKKTTCEPRLGHYHYVTVQWDPEMQNPNDPTKKGWWKMECGPAKTRINKKVFNEANQVNEEINTEVDLAEGDPKKSADLRTKPHTHVVTYHHSNEVTMKTAQAPRAN